MHNKSKGCSLHLCLQIKPQFILEVKLDQRKEGLIDYNMREEKGPTTGEAQKIMKAVKT